jgi:hypothetical protein
MEVECYTVGDVMVIRVCGALDRASAVALREARVPSYCDRSEPCS